MAWPRAPFALSIALLAASIEASAAPKVSHAPPRAVRDSSGAQRDKGVASTPPAATSARSILAAREQIHDGDLVRIQSEFGTFEGLASGADSTGVFGLRDRNAIGADEFSGQLEWGQIESVEIQGNSAKQSAIAGATVLGAIGLIGGVVAILGANTTSNPNLSWVVAPAMLGTAIGGGLGGAVGASKRVWRRVYP